MHQSALARTVLLLYAVALSVAPSVAAGPYAYYVHGRPVELEVDATRIAILADSPDAAAAAFARSAIGRITVEHYALDKWWTAATPDGLRSDAAIEQLIEDLAAQPESSFVSPVFYELGTLPLVITQQLLVRFEAHVTPGVAAAVLEGYGQVLDRDFGGVPNLYRVQSYSNHGFAVLAEADALRQLPGVAFAEPNRLRTLVHALIPNDPYFNRLWALHNTGQTIDGAPGGVADQDMDGPEAWDVTTGSSAVRVGIMDTGVQTTHPDLNIDPNLPGASFTGGGANGNPETIWDNHGTCVASCSGAKINNSLGVVGIAPNCRVVSVKIGRADNGGGTFVNQPDWTVSALNWCQANNVKITNCSWSGSGSDSETAAFATARLNGITHFAAAGNDGTLGGILFPANLPTVNCISGTTRWGVRWTSSNYGGDVDFAAPAHDIWCTDRTGGLGYASGDYVKVDGTSFASPFAAGVAAMVLSRNPTFTPDQIELVMQLTSVDHGTAGYDIEYGWGVVNAANAVNYVAAAPGTFSLVSPADNATGVSTNATFTWNAATAAQSYTLTIDSVPTFDSVNKIVYSGLTGTSYTLSGNPLLQQTTYYWKVAAINAFGQTTSTPASRAFTTFADCNANGVSDAAELAADPSLDCNQNGLLDSCDLQTSYAAGSLKLFPFGTGQPVPQYTLPLPRDAAGTVLLQFWAVGDLSAANEYVDVSINGTFVGRAFENGYFDCQEGAASINVPAATFNTLKANAGGIVTMTMVPSAGVNPTPPGCTGQVYIRTAVSYACVPFSQDTNSNGVPDECDGPAACPGDADCDGDIDFFDIDPFVGRLGCPGAGPECNDGCPWQNADADQNGVVDFFDIDPFVALLGTQCD